MIRITIKSTKASLEMGFHFLCFLLTLGAVEARTNSLIHIERGHPWRPPFGLDRVGQPTRVVVEPDAPAKPGEQVMLAGYRGGREAVRVSVEFTGGSPFVSEMDPSIDRVVLLAGGGQTWREVSGLSIERNGFEADA